MNFILRLLAKGLAILIAAYLVPGITIKSPGWAILVSAVLLLLNTLVKPFLIILTLPVTILTFGLFLLVINAGVIMLAGALVPGFDVESFWSALGFSILLAIIMSIMDALAEYYETR